MIGSRLKAIAEQCMRPARALAVLMVIAAVAAVADEGEHFLNAPGAQKYALILVGAAVDEERAGQFGEWALALRKSLNDEFGYPGDHLTLLVGGAEENDFNMDGPARAESIRRAFARLAGQVEPGDQLNVFLIGHGTGRGDQAKFNIVGPDLTGPQFAELLDTIKTPNIVVVNTTSASADFSKALAANGRVIVSATRSPAERFDTVFPGFFVEALQDHAADRDKNRRVSILEAFNYAKARVDEYFRERGTLPSEHATLDDNGDGVFSTRPDSVGDGRLAEIAYLDAVSASTTTLSPEAARLRSHMSNLERDIFLLRASKSELDETEYWTRLEPLLIELAKTTSEFDELSQ
ncbi:hypothetical protein ACXYTJ_08290 [Gilvimarinus sp. F26214L]|uniref:hypothetical protein n=1 Tax=Gilvimarinus sp. DZF01 TaxID=3461371 RepID=UPI0040451D3B